MTNHSFCRLLLAQLMPEVRAVFTVEEIEASWAWGSGGSHPVYEFHGPNDAFVTCSRADCLWSAKADGWSNLLAKLAPPEVSE